MKGAAFSDQISTCNSQYHNPAIQYDFLQDTFLNGSTSLAPHMPQNNNHTAMSSGASGHLGSPNYEPVLDDVEAHVAPQMAPEHWDWVDYDNMRVDEGDDAEDELTTLELHDEANMNWDSVDPLDGGLSADKVIQEFEQMNRDTCEVEMINSCLYFLSCLCTQSDLFFRQ